MFLTTEVTSPPHHLAQSFGQTQFSEGLPSHAGRLHGKVRRVLIGAHIVNTGLVQIASFVLVCFDTTSKRSCLVQ